MQIVQPSVRMSILLHGLNTTTFEELPWQVGLKTVTRAADAGFVEVEPGRILRPRCRLTQAGLSYRKQNSYVVD